MADITEVEQWDEGVYQLETTDPVQGGVDGVDNLPHKALANRTKWLKAGLEAVQNTISNLGNSFAALGGSDTQKFKVATATADDEAVTKAQLEAVTKAQLNEVQIISGENSNGKYTKFPDGTLICSHRKNFPNSAQNQSYDLTFPYAFVGDRPHIASNFTADTSNGANLENGGANPLSVTTLRMWYERESGPVYGAYGDYIAIGRWK